MYIYVYIYMFIYVCIKKRDIEERENPGLFTLIYSLYHTLSLSHSLSITHYGVAMVSRIDKIVGLFCRMLSLL